MIGQYLSVEECYKRGVISGESIGLLASTAAQRWPDRNFLTFDEEAYTFAELSDRVDATASDFLARGLQPGHRLFIQSDNSVGFLMIMLACWRIGIVPVPAIPAYRKHELLQILEDTQPAAVATTATLRGRFYLDELGSILDELNQTPIVRYIVDGPCDHDDWIPIPGRKETDRIAELPLPPDPAETAMILFTSGTTSRPKGVNISGRAIMANTLAWVRQLGLSEVHTWFAGWPLAHIGALSTAIFNPLIVGGKTVLTAAWNPEAAAEQIARHRVDFMGGAPIFLQDLIRVYKQHPEITHKIRAVGLGGAMVPPELVETADQMGIKGLRAFGMTELAGCGALVRPDDPLDRRSNWDGRVNLGTQIDIVDDNRQSVGFDALGEIRVRGPQTLLSYTEPEATAACMDEEGWLYTGDIGLVDTQGWLKVVGRKKDIINRGGEKFSSGDIEHALMSHASVDMAAIVGVPDERFGEKVAAFLELSEGQNWEGPQALLAHLEELKMAKIKYPVEWHVVDEMPRTASGKIQKNVLLDQRNDQLK